MTPGKLTDLEYLLLRFLAELGETHPYQLAREVEARGGRGVVTLAGLYRALARLERHRCLRSQWEDVDPREVGRPQRRLYKVTAIGERALRRAEQQRAALFPAMEGRA